MQPPLGAAIEGERVARGRSPGDAGWEREARAERRRRVGAGGAQPQEAAGTRATKFRQRRPVGLRRFKRRLRREFRHTDQRLAGLFRGQNTTKAGVRTRRGRGQNTTAGVKAR